MTVRRLTADDTELDTRAARNYRRARAWATFTQNCIALCVWAVASLVLIGVFFENRALALGPLIACFIVWACTSVVTQLVALNATQ